MSWHVDKHYNSFTAQMSQGSRRVALPRTQTRRATPATPPPTPPTLTKWPLSSVPRCAAQEVPLLLALFVRGPLWGRERGRKKSHSSGVKVQKLSDPGVFWNATSHQPSGAFGGGFVWLIKRAPRPGPRPFSPLSVVSQRAHCPMSPPPPRPLPQEPQQADFMPPLHLGGRDGGQYLPVMGKDFIFCIKWKFLVYF